MQKVLLSAFCMICALFGTILSFSFGGWSQALTFLMIAMAVDYITGVAAAIKEDKGLSSIVGSWGLARKGLTLLVILLAHQIDILLQSGEMVMSASVYFYLANELISIIENCGRVGLPIPKQIKGMIEVLKDRGKDE
ncbi:holin [Paenibacillaceae bacterium]|nr:holin [Paenibacillaceae bacterium]